MGANMKGTLGLHQDIFSTVAKKGINIRMIAQGSSELNISFVVKEKDGVAVVKAIHEEFNLTKLNSFSFIPFGVIVIEQTASLIMKDLSCSNKKNYRKTIISS